MDIWRSVENPAELYGRNQDLNAYNRHKGGNLIIQNNQAVDTSIVNESPLTSPVCVMVEPKKKEKKTSKKKKVINIAATQNGKKANFKVVQESPESNVAPAVVGNEKNKLGYGSASLIRTGSEDALERMRVCGQEQEEEKQEQEEPLKLTPPVVGIGKEKEK